MKSTAIQTLLEIFTGLLMAVRAYLVNNYMKLKAGKEKESVFAFFDNNEVVNVFKKYFILIPFYNASNNNEVDVLRKKLNLLTYTIYAFIIVLIIFIYL